jgi:hypothetical protein
MKGENRENKQTCYALKSTREINYPKNRPAVWIRKVSKSSSHYTGFASRQLLSGDGVGWGGGGLLFCNNQAESEEREQDFFYSLHYKNTVAQFYTITAPRSSERRAGRAEEIQLARTGNYLPANSL